MTKKEKAIFDSVKKEAEITHIVKSVSEAVKYAQNEFIKRLIPGHLSVNGYYAFRDKNNTKTLIILEK